MIGGFCDRESKSSLLNKIFFRTNITLSNVLHKWHAKELTSRAFCSFGALYIKEGKYVEAVEEFTKALACGMDNLLCSINKIIMSVAIH